MGDEGLRASKAQGCWDFHVKMTLCNVPTSK